MNASEGLRRVAAGVRWIGYSGVAGVVLFTLAHIFEGGGWTLPGTIGVTLATLIWLAICYGLAWIIEGFAQSRT